MSPFRRVNSRLCGESAIFFVTQLKVPFLSESYSLTRLKAIGVGVGRGWVWAEWKKNWQKRVEEKRRTDVRLDFKSSLGGCASRLNFTRPTICRPVVKCVDPLESRETKDGYFCTSLSSKMAREEQSITLAHFAQRPIFSMDPHFGRCGFRTQNHSVFGRFH